MTKIIVEIVFGTLIYGLLIYGPLSLIIFIFENIKYPNLYINTNKKTRFGFYFYINPEHHDIHKKYEKMYLKVIPIISFIIGLVYSFVDLVF